MQGVHRPLAGTTASTMDLNELIFLGDRTDVTTYLEGHGWQTTGISSNDLLIRTGLPPVEDEAHAASVLYIAAEK